MFMESVSQDKDIKDRKGTQPAKYHKAGKPQQRKREMHSSRNKLHG